MTTNSRRKHLRAWQASPAALFCSLVLVATTPKSAKVCVSTCWTRNRLKITRLPLPEKEIVLHLTQRRFACKHLKLTPRGVSPPGGRQTGNTFPYPNKMSDGRKTIADSPEMEEEARPGINYPESSRRATMDCCSTHPNLARPTPLHPTGLSPYPLHPFAPLPFMHGLRSPFAGYSWPRAQLNNTNLLQSWFPSPVPDKAVVKNVEASKCDFTKIDSLSMQVSEAAPSAMNMPLSPRDFPWIYHPYHNDFFRYVPSSFKKNQKNIAVKLPPG